MKSVYRSAVIAVCVFIGFIVACKTSPLKDVRETELEMEIKKYLAVDDSAPEVFRVLMMSDRYCVSQMKYAEKLRRVDDQGGDKYICEEIKKLDKIDDTREGIITVWLFPDSGRLMRVRPKMLTYLVETDKLMVEDIQRWNFTTTEKTLQPTQFDVKYRIVLRKTQSDDEIMKEVREKLKGKTASH